MSEYKLKPSKQAEAAVRTYRKIEDMVVGGYKKIEDTVVGGYKQVERKFTDAFLEKQEEEPCQDGEQPSGKEMFS